MSISVTESPSANISVTTTPSAPIEVASVVETAEVRLNISQPVAGGMFVEFVDGGWTIWIEDGN